MTCPACGRPDNRKTDLEEMIALLHAMGFRNGGPNPGGYLFYKRDTRLQIGDQCFACDLDKVKLVLDRAVDAEYQAELRLMDCG